MGTGKTLVAVEVMKRSDKATAVICPRVVKPAWERTAAMQGTDLSVINWEMCRTGRTPFGEWYIPPKCRKPRFRWNSAIEFLIFDEIHRAQGDGTKNSELVKAARRQGIPSLGLSATPADSPLEMDALGYLLRLHDSDEPETVHKEPLSFYRWARRHGCGPGAFSRFEFLGSQEAKVKHMAKINAMIFPDRGVRVRIADLGDAFPETQILPELYDLEDDGQIDAAYAEMRSALTELEGRIEECKEELKRKALARGVVLTPIESPAELLLRARQRVELLKVPLLVELTQEAKASGHSVVIFVNFRQTLVELCKRLNTDCFIDGTQTGPEGDRQRENNRLRFQTDQAREIICNGEAGGIGMDLHDVTRRFPRMVLDLPGYSAKTARQKWGRVHRAGALSKSIQRIVLAAGTDEEGVYHTLYRKLQTQEALVDGDFMPERLNLKKFLVSR
jgi:superfamily II DNA or RNA helicase